MPQDPAKLRGLITVIDSETWVGMDIDVKGKMYYYEASEGE